MEKKLGISSNYLRLTKMITWAKQVVVAKLTLKIVWLNLYSCRLGSKGFGWDFCLLRRILKDQALLSHLDVSMYYSTSHLVKRSIRNISVPAPFRNFDHIRSVKIWSDNENGRSSIHQKKGLSHATLSHNLYTELLKQVYA